MLTDSEDEMMDVDALLPTSYPGFSRRECNKECAIPSQQCTYIYLNEGEECSDGWKVGESIDNENQNSVIFQVCKNSNCEYVLKYIPKQLFDLEKFRNEINLHTLAARNNLAPKIIQVTEHSTEGSIVMESLDITAYHYIKNKLDEDDVESIENMAYSCSEIIGALHDLKIYHNDAHLNNFMLKENDWYLIDFGSAQYVPYPDSYQSQQDYMDFFGGLARITNKGFFRKLDQRTRKNYRSMLSDMSSELFGVSDYEEYL